MLSARPPARHARPTSPPARKDAGTTLVELLVGMVMAAVVGTTVVLFMINTLRGTRQADGENEQAAVARVALQSWSLLARLAVDPSGSSVSGTARFVSMTPTEAQFCAALGTKGADPDVKGGVIGVSFKLASEQLIETRWTTCAAMVSGAAAYDIRILVPRAAQLLNTWLVTPLAAGDLPVAGAVSAALLTSSLTPGSKTLSTASIPLVVGVQLAFQTLPDPLRPATAGTYSTVLTLPIGS